MLPMPSTIFSWTVCCRRLGQRRNATESSLHLLPGLLVLMVPWKGNVDWQPAAECWPFLAIKKISILMPKAQEHQILSSGIVPKSDTGMQQKTSKIQREHRKCTLMCRMQRLWGTHFETMLKPCRKRLGCHHLLMPARTSESLHASQKLFFRSQCQSCLTGFKSKVSCPKRSCQHTEVRKQSPVPYPNHKKKKTVTCSNGSSLIEG